MWGSGFIYFPHYMKSILYFLKHESHIIIIVLIYSKCFKNLHLVNLVILIIDESIVWSIKHQEIDAYLSRVQGDVTKCLVFSDKQSKTQKIFNLLKCKTKESGKFPHLRN